TGPGRTAAERDAVALSEQLGERLAANDVPMSDAVTLFVAARRPFLSELSIAARRRGVDAARIGQLYDASTSLLDRLLPPVVAAPAPAPAAPPPGLAFRVALSLLDQWLERRQGFQAVWCFGMVCYGLGAGAEAIAASSG